MDDNSGSQDASDDHPPVGVMPDQAEIADSEVASPLASHRPHVERLWNDWRWQMRHRIRAVDQLKELFNNLDVENGIADTARKYPLAITPYYASLIRKPDDSDPIFRMSVPQAQELVDPSFLSSDPLEENRDMPVPGLVHRYRDRVLLITTTTCAMYCRHCTRKRIAGVRESSISATRLRAVVEYLREHSEVHDVIISGGDPFTMSTDALQRVLSAIRSVPTVDVIRIGTRIPVTLPMRITSELTSMLRKFHPIWVNTHFNHPNEITPESAAACARLADAGIPLGNQSVLLRGVNDDPRIMERLCRGLLRMRVRPYYLFQCDLVCGVEHFRTPISAGIQIMEYLRGRVSGLGIPTFVVDAPGGRGKIPVLPNYVVSTSPTHTVLRNFKGELISYAEPVHHTGRNTPHPLNNGSDPTIYDLTAGWDGSDDPIDAPCRRRDFSRKGPDARL